MNKNINYIFVGGMTPTENHYTEQKKSKLPLQYAAQTFQWAFIEGIEENLQNEICLISAPFYSSFPKYHDDLFIRGSSFQRKENHNNKIVGYINIAGIKNIFKLIGLSRYITKYAKLECKNIIFIYSLNLAYIASAILSRIINSNIKICVIITDLPDHPADCSLLYKKYLKFIEGPIIKKIINLADSFVVLTEHIPAALNINPKKCITIEGLYKNCIDINAQRVTNKHKILLYTGTLDKRYGVEELIKNFQSIKDDNIELWICGGGPLADYIKNIQNFDSRIKYLGMLPRSKIIDIQSRSDLLINPRNNSGEFNKYSFPSKIMEYMASGTPVLAYRLDGIPDEYYKHIFTVNTTNNESLAQAITRVLSMNHETLSIFGKQAQKFIIDNKKNTIQTKKILDFVENL